MVRNLRIVIVACIAFCIVCTSLVVYAVQPTEKNLDLEYQSIPWADKIAGALLNRGIVTLTDQDVTNLFKERLEQKKQDNHISITGAKLAIEADQIHGCLVAQKGILPIGVSFTASVRLIGQDIVIAPKRYWIGKISMQPDTFTHLLSLLHDGTLPQEFRVQLPLPPGIAIKSVQIETGKVNLQFALKRIF